MGPTTQTLPGALESAVHRSALRLDTLADEPAVSDWVHDCSFGVGTSCMDPALASSHTGVHCMALCCPCNSSYAAVDQDL